MPDPQSCHHEFWDNLYMCKYMEPFQNVVYIQGKTVIGILERGAIYKVFCNI